MPDVWLFEKDRCPQIKLAQSIHRWIDLAIQWFIYSSMKLFLKLYWWQVFQCPLWGNLNGNLRSMHQIVLARWEQTNLLSYMLLQCNIDTSLWDTGSTCPSLESLDYSGSDIIWFPKSAYAHVKCTFRLLFFRCFFLKLSQHSVRKPKSCGDMWELKPLRIFQTQLPRDYHHKQDSEWEPPNSDQAAPKTMREKSKAIIVVLIH